MTSSTKPLRIMISAGELSGDEHGARLVQAIREISPNTIFFGMGLKNLRREGVELLVDGERSGSIMGFAELLGGLSRVYQALSTLKRALRQDRPDVLVIINYSDFNLRLAQAAKKAGVKVVFFIPPQVWAWRAGRVATMDRVCDSIVTIFPFERAFYEARGCKKVTYVGHPFTGATEYQQLTQEKRDAARLEVGITPRECLLVCFLGSRKKEVIAHLDFAKQVMERLNHGRPHLRVHVVSPRAEWQEWLESEFSMFSQVKITVGHSVKMLQIADVGLIKSGTSNLQAVFAGLPFVMYYRVARITGLIARVFIKGVKSFSIVNIIKPGTISEIVGEELSVDAAVKALERLIDSPEARDALNARYQEIIAELRTFDPLPEVNEPSTPFSRAAHVILNCAHHE